MKNKIYIIDGKTYLNHINDEVHLYGLLHQLAFLAGRIKDEEDVFHVLDAAKRYGEIAEEKFQGWGIPGRYLVFGDPKDLKDLMAKELAEATPVPVEEPKPKKYKDEYIIPPPRCPWRSRSPRSIRMSTSSPAMASVCWWATSTT